MYCVNLMSRLLRRLFPDLSERSTATSCRELELSDLSDWDLLCLMDVLPLEDLMRLGCTNHRFNQLAKRRQPGRRRLLLIIGPKGAQYNEHDVIYVPALTFTVVDRILSKLPSIDSLFVFNNSSASENLEPTIYLLGRLSAQLQELTLVFNEEFNPPTSHQPLFAAINGLGKLTRLFLQYQNDSQPFTDDEPAIFHLPIIAQLAFFHFLQRATNVDPMLRELIKRATATLPTQISVIGTFDQVLRDIPPGLASRFINLGLYSDVFNSVDLANICDNFSNLTMLGFKANHLTIRQISLNLAKLPYLSKLFWIIDFPNRTIWRQPDVALAEFGEAAEPDVIDSAQVVPLPNVTVLELNLYIEEHDDLALLHLGTLFPNVTTLEVFISGCDQCGYNEEEINPLAKKRCPAKLIKYWRALPKLQQLEVNDQILRDRDWKPLPLLGVSRFQLRHTIMELVDPVNKITSWITSKFTGA